MHPDGSDVIVNDDIGATRCVYTLVPEEGGGSFGTRSSSASQRLGQRVRVARVGGVALSRA